VSVDLLAGGVIAGIPRCGASTLILRIGVTAGFDPACQLAVYDMSGASDLAALRTVAHRLVPGSHAVARLRAIADLRAVAAEIDARNDVRTELPRPYPPEQLAELAGYGFGAVLVLVEHVERWIGPQALSGAALAPLVHHLVSQGPAVGVAGWFTTTNPAALPHWLRSGVGTRVCFQAPTDHYGAALLGRDDGHHTTLLPHPGHALVSTTGRSGPAIRLVTVPLDHDYLDALARHARTTRHGGER
jgi:hypothetical protein